MSPTLRAPKDGQRKIPGTAEFKVSKITQHSTFGLTDSKPSIATQLTTPVKSKLRRESKYLKEAHRGNLESMVKAGWGLDTMLQIYNHNQIEKGLPKLEQIEDVRILRLVEKRKVIQRENTRRYQARNAALASLGDFRAARKLKWSAPRMKALELWVRNGSIGRFEEKHKQEESADSKELDDESESESEPETVPKLELDVEMEDNIQVASPPGKGCTRKMALMPAHTVTSIGKTKNTNTFLQLQPTRGTMGKYPEDVIYNSPTSIVDDDLTDLVTASSHGTCAFFGSGFTENERRNSRTSGTKRVESGASHTDGTQDFLTGNSVWDYANYAFQTFPTHSRHANPFMAANLENKFHDLQQETNNMQHEADVAVKDLQVAQIRANQANESLFAAQVREFAHGQDSSYVNGQDAWWEETFG